MAKLRGSKNDRLQFIAEQLQIGLDNPELLTGYVKAIISLCKKEIIETGKNEKQRQKT